MLAMRLSRYAGACPGDRTLRAARREDRPDGFFHHPRRLFELGWSSWKMSLPRKEVIQPHVPVRLPCYDFTPLTLHTFDASLPEGLGRRLRVQTTRVV